MCRVSNIATREVTTDSSRGTDGDPSSLTGYLPTLDGWRALAILGVMLRHANETLCGPGGVYPSEYLAVKLSYGGWGVDFFFGLSGFLITARLLEEKKKWAHISLRSFYVRRAFRILPPIVTYLAALGLLSLAHRIVTGYDDYLSSLFFYRNYNRCLVDGNASITWYTGHFWSLSVEEHFYLLWPTLLIGLLASGVPLRGVAFVSLLVVAWHALDSRFQWSLRLLGLDTDCPTRTDYCLDKLLWGCWVALALGWGPSALRWLPRLLSGPFWWALLLLAALSMFAPGSIQLGQSWWLPFVIPLLIAGTVVCPRGPVGTFLEWRPLRWIGRLSYSLYIWQQLFLVPQPKFSMLPALPPLVTFCLVMALSFGCAALSYYFVEQPMIRLGHRLSRRPSGAAARDASAAD